MTSTGRDLRAAAYNILGIVSDQQQQLDQAEGFYLRALTADPSLIAARNNLGNLYYKTKREKQAVLEYQLVLRADPSHTEANLNLGLIYQSNGQLQQAIRHLEKAREHAGSDARLMLTLAGLYFETIQKDRALAAIADLVKSSDDDLRVHFTVGLMLARRELYKEAAEHFELVASRQPDSYEAVYNYGLALYNLNDATGAERALRAAAGIKPDLPEPHERLAGQGRAVTRGSGLL